MLTPRWYVEGAAVFMETWMAGGIGRAQSAYDEMVGKGASSSGDNTMELSLGDQPLPEWLN